MPRVSRYRGSIVGPRPTGSTPSCSSAGSWGGCVGNEVIAAWRARPRLPKRTPSGRTASATAWWGNAREFVNRIKSTLARLGIRNFKPTLRKAAERLATVHTPEGVPLPPNTLAELQRDIARLGFVVSQISEMEDARQKRLEQQPEPGPHAMVRLLARIVGVGVETADMLVHEVLSRPMRDRRAVARYAGLTGSPDES